MQAASTSFNATLELHPGYQVPCVLLATAVQLPRQQLDAGAERSEAVRVI